MWTSRGECSRQLTTNANFLRRAYAQVFLRDGKRAGEMGEEWVGAVGGEEVLRKGACLLELWGLGRDFDFCSDSNGECFWESDMI